MWGLGCCGSSVCLTEDILIFWGVQGDTENLPIRLSSYLLGQASVTAGRSETVVAGAVVGLQYWDVVHEASRQ